MNAQKEMYLLRNRYSTTLSREEIENLSLWAQKRPEGIQPKAGKMAHWNGSQLLSRV
jgi:hypothetical protein